MGKQPARIGRTRAGDQRGDVRVRNFGCMAPKTFGSRPSCDIVSQMRACGMIMVMITEVSPNSAPR